MNTVKPSPNQLVSMENGRVWSLSSCTAVNWVQLDFLLKNQPKKINFMYNKYLLLQINLFLNYYCHVCHQILFSCSYLFLAWKTAENALTNNNPNHWNVALISYLEMNHNGPNYNQICITTIDFILCTWTLWKS